MADALSTGKSALLAFQASIATISHNVANAATAGYSRQRVDLEARQGPAGGRLPVGAGVAATRIQRLADSLVFSRQVGSSGEMGRLTQLGQYSSRVDRLVTDPATGLGSHWSAFFAANQDIVNEPTSTITRNALITSAEQLTARWGTIDGQLEAIDIDSNQKLITQVGAANQLAGEIASLNKQVIAGGQNVPNTLLDQRAVKLTELSRLVGGSIVEQGDGTISLFTDNGLGLVMGSRSMKLTTVTDPFNPLRSNVALQTPNGTLTLASDALGGEVGGVLEFRTTVLDPARAELDREAAAFAVAYNRAHTTGVDYNGNLGTAFFSIPDPSVAANPKNAGTASFSGAIADLGALDGQDVLLKFDGINWAAVRPDTGEGFAMTGSGGAGDPFVVNGVALTVSGTAAAGDSFLMRPVRGAAAGLEVLVSDPNLVAAASPMNLTLGATNTGTVTAASSKITDPAAYAGFAGAAIEFVSADSYTIDGGAPIAYTTGDKITGAGWELTLDGAPAAGDTFNLQPTGARSSDNGNARVLGRLDQAPLFDGGRVSLTDAMGQFTAKIGSAAQLADMNLDAQDAINTQIQFEREAVSGVNLDEEAANLLKFQQAYQAASQVIVAANEMFDALMAAVRR